MSTELAEDAVALYDRQIRLWGAAAQMTLMQARVVLVEIGPLGAEIAKNLVLGGIGSIVVVDGGVVSGKERTFLTDATQEGEPRASASERRLQELNPRVKVKCMDVSWRELDDAFWSDFDVIVGTQTTSGDLETLDSISRVQQVPFLAGACHGLYAMAFVDGNACESWVTREKNPHRALGPLDAYGLRELVHFEDLDENGTHWDKCLVKTNYRPWHKRNGTYIKAMYPNAKRLAKRVPQIFVGMLSLLELGPNDGLEELKTHAENVLMKFELPDTMVSTNTLETLLQNQGVAVGPVAAIMGGFLAQTVINVLVKRDVLPNNFVVLDGVSGEMPIFPI